jgi:hypothetical protein
MSNNSYHISITADEVTDQLAIEFMHVVGEEEFLDFEVLKQKNFMKYRPHIAIHRFEDNDCTYVFFGTNLVKNFCEEHTGSKVSELANEFRKQALTGALYKIIKTQKAVYAMGDLKVDGKEYLK